MSVEFATFTSIHTPPATDWKRLPGCPRITWLQVKSSQVAFNKKSNDNRTACTQCPNNVQPVEEDMGLPCLSIRNPGVDRSL